MRATPLFQGEIITKSQKYIGEIQNFSSEEPLGQFQPNLAQSFIEWRELQILQLRIIQLPKRDDLVFPLQFNFMIYL